MNNKYILFKFKTSYSISYNDKYICTIGKKAVLYSAANGEKMAEFSNMKYPSVSRFLSDDRLIVKTATGKYYIYNTETKELLKKINPPKGVLSSTSKFTVTPDNKYIIDFAYIFPKSDLLLIDIETGQQTVFKLDNATNCCVFYDRENMRYFVAASTLKTDTDKEEYFVDFYTFSYPFESLHLEKLQGSINKTTLRCDYALGKFAFCCECGKIDVYDVVSNTVKQINFEEDLYISDLKWSDDGKYIAVSEPYRVSVFDATSKRCIRTYDTDQSCFVSFYDNNTKLLIGGWTKGFCINLDFES